MACARGQERKERKTQEDQMKGHSQKARAGAPETSKQLWEPRPGGGIRNGVTTATSPRHTSPPLSLNRTSCPYCPGPAFVAQTSEGESGNSTLALGRLCLDAKSQRGQCSPSSLGSPPTHSRAGN